MKLASSKYQDIEYEKGEDIYLSPEEADTSFWFDVESDLTEDDEAMTNVAVALDELDAYEEAAKRFLKKTLEDEESEFYETVSFFMEFHRDDVDPDTARELFPVDDPSTLTFIEMVDYLKIDRFGSLVNENSQQAFIMDLCFNKDVTDELLVIYFDLDRQIYDIAHES